MKASIRPYLRQLAEQGTIKALVWYASLPDRLGRRDRRCYFSFVDGHTRDFKEQVAGTISRSLEFKSWGPLHEFHASHWSFVMHDVPEAS